MEISSPQQDFKEHHPIFEVLRGQALAVPEHYSHLIVRQPREILHPIFEATNVGREHLVRETKDDANNIYSIVNRRGAFQITITPIDFAAGDNRINIKDVSGPNELRVVAEMIKGIEYHWSCTYSTNQSKLRKTDVLEDDRTWQP